MTDPLALAHFSTHGLRRFLREAPRPVVLWPVGSTEPHGPHLPLATDVILAEENARRAARALRADGVAAVVAPALPYGVTEFARGFTGAVSIPAETLVALVCAAADHFLADGFRHLSLVCHHLEQGHLEALQRAREAIAAKHGAHAVSFPQVISRRWGGRLGAEFRSGACHAGEYETSLVLAASPERVDAEAMRALPELAVSLSEATRAGLDSFAAAGMAEAYTGHPATASVAEGERLYAVLTEMVVTEIREALEMKP